MQHATAAKAAEGDRARARDRESGECRVDGERWVTSALPVGARFPFANMANMG